MTPRALRMRRPALCTLILGMAWLSSSPVAHAVEKVAVDDPETLVVQQLTLAYDLHVDAAADLISATQGSRRPRSADLDRLTHRWRQATVGSMNYTWSEGGTVRRRSYHGLSGRDASAQLGLHESREPGASTSGGRRLAANTPHARTVLDGGDAMRVADAEAKLLRTLEADVLDGIVPRGGQVRIWVSQQACASCTSIAQRFENAYGSRVTIFELARANRADPGAAFSRLDAHRKTGYRRLRDRIAVGDRHRLKASPGATAGCLP